MIRKLSLFSSVGKKGNIFGYVHTARTPIKRPGRHRKKLNKHAKKMYKKRYRGQGR